MLETKEYTIKICVFEDLLKPYISNYVIDSDGTIIDNSEIEGDVITILIAENNKTFYKFNREHWTLRVISEYFKNDIRTPRQIRGLYTLLIYLKNEYNITHIYSTEKCGFDANKETMNLNLLLERELNARNELKILKQEIEDIRNKCAIEYEEEPYTKEDILNSKYCLIQNVGLKKLNYVLSKYEKNPSKCYKHISKKITFPLEDIMTYPINDFIEELKRVVDIKKHDIKSLICIASMESSCCTYLGKDFNYENFEYISPFFVFNNWCTIMKIFPIKYTKEIIDGTLSKELTKNELIDLLTAHILNYTQYKSVKDIGEEEMYDAMIEVANKGIYNPGFNHVQGKYVLNMWNLIYFMFYNYLDEIKEIKLI